MEFSNDSNRENHIVVKSQFFYVISQIGGGVKILILIRNEATNKNNPGGLFLNLSFNGHTMSRKSFPTTLSLTYECVSIREILGFSPYADSYTVRLTLSTLDKDSQRNCHDPQSLGWPNKTSPIE